MTWEYALIGLVIGIIIGAVTTLVGNRKLRQQQTLQYELNKSNAELDEYHKKLTSYFANSAKLLDNIANDYHQLYQHMTKSSNSLLPDQRCKNNLFCDRLTEAETNNDQTSVEMQPLDYPESTSGLPHIMRGLRK